ncbi:RHS repeat-associated core domain-containing protein [Amycolatopsis umgeniensis]|uniref:RHS repeat-associated protein n=1 Tax=Amycolatopsis umgeniensis TaxID=336628 RepID=A0A841BFZ7_9PSEU|nr:RHS repeat-associated core domain-containing protein [Amycolatopsis umgeniensis]MBB5857623.1 RHS repeat-associated protein [Amycolatopsis umgeniensis]
MRSHRLRSQWTIRGLVVVLAASLIPALTTSMPNASAAPAANEPPLSPPARSVPVAKETRKSREPDQTSRRALSNNQQPVTEKPGSGLPAATPLSPTATWDINTHAGDFSWSYPMKVPPAPGGFAPKVALSYQSSAVDGATSETNNQPSWIGDGWSMWPGFIERSYWSCADDDAKTGDLCWRSDNATASYGDGGGMLICCDGSGKWRLKGDDGARIERRNGLANGDEFGEHWVITTVDGTQYWFGSEVDSKSTWTVPVFGDDANEPCHRATFDTSHCDRAWRWNLDKVIDRNGNVIRYYYAPESNSYGFNTKDAARSYIRGGTLERIDYGLHEPATGPATGRVEFATAKRCVAGSTCTEDQRGNWPDTPLKMSCGGPTCKEHSPSFWTTQRLDSVTTKVWRGSSYEPVDRWTLDQTFPRLGDVNAEQKESAVLWLKGIKHTGLVGGALDMPPVTFDGTLMPNRVDGDKDGYAPLNRYRITGVISEYGGVVAVDYAPPDCKAGQAMPANPETNQMRCFPVRWAPPGHEPRVDYFHKYVVSSVTRTDMIATNPEHTTRYEYLDGAAWHWNTSEFVKEDKKTWNEFRGFGRVRITEGADPAQDPGRSPRTMSELRYYRGMDSDRLPNNGRRPVSVTDSVGDGQSSRKDDEWLRSFNFETTTYGSDSATNPPVVSRVVSHPDWRGPTASRGEYHAYLVRPGRARTFTALSSGGWRVTETKTGYDDRGLPVQMDDLGDVATAEDDLCTTATYARDENTWHLTRKTREETVSVACGGAARYPEDAVSDTLFGYDGKGNVNRTEVAKERPATGPVYVKTSELSHDIHGRVTQSTDALGNVGKTGYLPATGGPVTQVTTTSPPTAAVPAGLVTTATLETAFGAAVKVVDPNGRVTETSLDPLGRKAQLWLPNRRRASNPEGSLKFGYLVRRDDSTVVTTSKIGPNGVHVTKNEVYDGLLRLRQTQAPAVGMREENAREIPFEEGRLITDTRYDSHGRPYKQTNPYFNDGPVDTSLWRASDAEVPGMTRKKFDGAGRVVETVHQAGSSDEWATYTGYDGDRVHTTPPAGGTATTAVSDAKGRTVELRQYHGPKPEGPHDVTRYRYTPAGKLAGVTGPDNAIWSYGYDLRGRKTLSSDLDAGQVSMTYDDLGRLTGTKDALGKILATTYDPLGRKTALYADSPSGPKLAEWTFDTAQFGKGMPASSSRYVDGNTYSSTISGYTALNNPLSTAVTIPGSEGKLSGTYQRNFAYGQDGTLTGETYPAVPAAGTTETSLEQTVSYQMDNSGHPTSTQTGTGTPLVFETHYTRYGEVQRLEQGNVGSRAWQSFSYDASTRRPDRFAVHAEVPHPIQSDVRYTYDQAGNITSTADVPIGSPSDVQCFRYDSMRRLTEAWTAAQNDWSAEAGCKAEPTAGQGPAPYWNSYRHAPGGNRLEETKRNPTAAVTRGYAYAGDRQPQPHTLRSVSDPAGSETFEYDAKGQTTKRTKPGLGQDMTWDEEGHLTSVSANGKTTSFVYAPGGSRLLRKDPAGTTLYLGKQEIRLPAGADKPVVTRYYTHGDKTIAVHDGNALNWLAGDHQGTAQIAIDSKSSTVTKRRQDPYGAPRGEVGTWPSERGFVGGTQDASTGLTHLGAREYDPGTGRFLSVDPVMDPADPQQMQGYAYANASPVTMSDPTGLAPCSGPDGVGCRMDDEVARCCSGPEKLRHNVPPPPSQDQLRDRSKKSNEAKKRAERTFTPWGSKRNPVNIDIDSSPCPWAGPGSSILECGPSVRYSVCDDFRLLTGTCLSGEEAYREIQRQERDKAALAEYEEKERKRKAEKPVGSTGNCLGGDAQLVIVIGVKRCTMTDDLGNKRTMWSFKIGAGPGIGASLSSSKSFDKKRVDKLGGGAVFTESGASFGPIGFGASTSFDVDGSGALSPDPSVEAGNSIGVGGSPFNAGYEYSFEGF